MIYVDKKLPEESFLTLLEATRQGIMKTFAGGMPKGMNGNLFEDAVYAQMVKSSVGTEFEGHIEQTGAHTFPDIIARKLFGVEVNWTICFSFVTVLQTIL